MQKITLIATCKQGLELPIKMELDDLGFTDLTVSPGRVEFVATAADIPRANIWLRCADRVRLKMAEFKAVTFDELFEQTKALPWEAWIPADGRFDVTGKSQKSTLFSVRSCQAIVKKAVADRLFAAHDVDELPETGAEFTVQVALNKDMALLTLDTSGGGLHRRGYRLEAGEAPLKETLAAALVRLSFWHENRRLLDPMCGAGTILIEAAMLGRNIAPGLNREFASEGWPAIGQYDWYKAREDARNAVRPSQEEPLIFGYDIDPEAIAMAQRNAERAGVADDIIFETKDIHDLWIDRQYGIVITNPPYGRRLAEYQAMNAIYITLHKTFKKKSGWSVFVLTADEKFPDYFKRAYPDRVRKLYNGNIRANYYQYHGERPR